MRTQPRPGSFSGARERMIPATSPSCSATNHRERSNDGSSTIQCSQLSYGSGANIHVSAKDAICAS